MIDGFYAIYFTGHAGSGFGVIALQNGIVTGADAVGGIIDGEFALNEASKSYEGTVQLCVPAGAILVTGGAPHNESYSISFPISIPKDDVEGEHPVLVQLPTGPVNIILKKLRDIPH